MERDTNERIKEINNFSDLVQEFHIMIPTIQRDYVQGNEADEGIRSNRDAFIQKIYTALMKHEEMDMQYIFGIVKDGDTFLPIDGQQRLTTMYLLSWFCAVRENRFDDFKDRTKGFSYQVRTSSADFFQALRDENNLNEFQAYAAGTLQNMKDSAWYRRNWRPDNTINNAISFLNAAREVYQEQVDGENTLFDVIFPGQSESKCPIHFIVICQNGLDNHGENQDSKSAEADAFEAENRAAVTYINMNSRGKQLTEFESLKNKFHRVSEEGRKFAKNYDGQYINIFKRLLENYATSKDDKKRRDTLDGLVKEMDEYAKNLLVFLYFDLQCAQNGQNNIAKPDFYALREELEKTDVQIPDDYFSLIDDILVNETIQEDSMGECLWAYVKGQAATRKWDFFRIFWARYKGIELDEWDWFLEHSDLQSLQYSQYKRSDNYVYLYKVICEIAEKYDGSTMSYLVGTDINDLYNAFGKELDRAVLREEQIFADFYLQDQSKFDVLKGIGHRIRHLFYICGYWDEVGDVKDDRWELFEKYRSYDEIYRDDNSVASCMLWKKLYYLKSLPKDQAGNYMLPEAKTDTIWKKEYLEWTAGNFDVAKSVLERTKACYEEISSQIDSQREPANQDIKIIPDTYMQHEISSLGKDSWLYYVLRNEIDDLFMNVTKKDNGIYKYRSGDVDINYFLYVYSKIKECEICNKGIIEILISNQTPYNIQKIAGYSKNRNLYFRFELNVTVLDENERMYSEVMEKSENDLLLCSVEDIDSKRGVTIKCQEDMTTKASIQKDLESIYQGLQGWIQNQVLVKFPDLLQNIAYKVEVEEEYKNATHVLVNELNDIIQDLKIKNMITYNYRAEETCHKHYGYVTIQLQLVDDDNHPIQPFFKQPQGVTNECLN